MARSSQLAAARCCSVALVLGLTLLPGCRTGLNYPDPKGPRYAGGPPGASVIGRDAPDTLRIVTFNIEYAIQVDSAIAVLTSDTALQGADIVLLQEMDQPATQRIADTLGLWYVYYPAVFRFSIQRQLGNAILSRWPIVEDRKILLPHLSRIVRSQRVATAATIRIGGSPVRIYSLHLGTMAGLAPRARRDQLRTVLADAERYPRVVIGGDMNDAGIGQVAVEAGYAWPTKRGPYTTRVGRLDHVFLKGLASPSRGTAAGTVLDARGSSDHLPVWAVAVLH